MHQMIKPGRNLRKGVLVILAFALAIQPVPALAMGFAPPKPLSGRQEAYQNIIFTGGGDEDTTCEANGDASLSGSSNLEKIYNYFISKGLSPEQAAGVVGNIDVESGGDPENIQNPGGRTKNPASITAGWGLIQWTPGSKIIGLLSQANITTPVHELATQLELVWWHMGNISPTGHKNMLEGYKKINDIGQATTYFHDTVEGSADTTMTTRIERAKEALKRYGAGGGDSSSNSTGGCDSGEGGVASANGFTFPLKTTQKALKTNANGKWCHGSQANCHHDYNAADLMIPTGTVVIAAKTGTVVSVNSGNQHPNNVTIKSQDGEGINYYTHMGANTVKLRTGQKVQAGDELGRVGTSQDAMGTPPHLHFDILPPRYPYRPGCSGAACRDLPFLNVQPALIETFKKLPES